MYENHIAKTELQESTIYLSKKGAYFSITTFRGRKPHYSLTCDSESFALRLFFDQIEKAVKHSKRLKSFA